MARMARISSRIRGAGCDHGMENRFSMWGLICEPSPSMNRPSDMVWRSLATMARFIGLRAKATAMPGAQLDPLGVLGRQHQGEERVVAGLGRPDPVVADLLGQSGRLDDPAGVESDASVDVHGPR